MTTHTKLNPRTAIKNRCTRVWRQSFISETIDGLTAAGYDVEYDNTTDNGTLIVGDLETGQVYMTGLRKNIKGKNADWIITYNTKLFGG